MIAIQKALFRLAGDFRALEVRWALVGGMAVSALAEPRTTQDVDVVLALPTEAEAERLVLLLRMRGYHDHPKQPLMQKKGTGRLLGVRLLAPLPDEEDTIVDLLFAMSGVEAEIVAAAQVFELMPGLYIPVARAGHILAMKILAGRLVDQVDAQRLLAVMDESELQRAREALVLISSRGFDEGKNLLDELERLQNL